jgi:hypothetical protein
MRKLVVFLIVFAIGLALVLWLRGSEPEKALPQSPAGDAEKPTEFTEFPVKGDKPDEPSRPVGVSLDGRLDLVQRSGDGTTLKPLYELHADDVDLVGGDVYELKVLTIDVRNLDTGELRAQMSAAKGRMKLVVVDGTPAIGPEEHATFDDVELTLHEGVPIVPLTLEMPHLDWELSTNRFRSDDRVKLRGQGLTAEGVGLDADPTVERVHLAKEGVLRLDVENGAQMTLSATGAGQIMVEREMIDGEPAVHLRAFDGSRLVQTGERAVSVDAERLNLHGREGREAHGFELVAADASGDVAISSQGSVFRAARADFRFDGNGKLQTAHLEGDVVLEGVNDIFRADQADFHFDASGALRRADLVGSPSGTIQVGRFLTPEVAGAHDVPTTTKAEISGVGPLVVEFGPRTTLDLKGPGELRVPAFDFALQAQRSLQAELDQDRQRGELVADGAVTARYQGSDLASEKLTLNYSAGVPGQELVDAVTEGPTTLRGAVPGDARLIVLEAQQGLSVQSKGDGLTVPIARAARITVADPDGVEARAALVRDFDWRARTFVAEGDVSYAGPNGQGRASRVVSHGPDDLELFGESGALARYEFREVGETTIEALTEAIEIHARKDVLDATGEARATVAAQDRKYELQGAKLHLDLAPAVPGEELRPFHAEAEDGVRTTILFVAGNGHLSCDKLFVDGVLKRTRDPAEKLPVTKSDLRAVGNVRLEYHTLGDAIGECDLFTLDREGRGRMSADPGRRIRAEGRLPTGIAPYEMTAEWLEFDPKHLEAAAVDVKLKIDGLTPEARRALNATAPLLELSTDRFVADSTQVLMRGKAHAKGRSAQDEDWWIDAGSLRLEGQWLDGRASKQDALDGAHAWDGFEAGFGARAHAFGERLDGSPERLRIEGTPARLSMDTMEWESSWIQYERANMLLSTDRGYLHPREEASKSDWSVTYESMQPFDHDESTTILVLRNPLFRQGEDEMRADWALFWVDRGEWMKSGKTAIKEETGEPDLRVRVPEPPPPPPAKRGPPGPLDLARLSGSRIGKVLNEVYVEGNIEFLRNNARTARAKSIYLDIVEGHGWIQDADVLTDVKLRGRKQRLRAKADWMRVSNDSSMRADNAVITSCDYDAPHYVIKTGRLEVKRTEEGGFSVSATQNELAFGDTVAIPMPPLVYAADENFVPLIDNIAAGNFAKFGTSVTASFNFTLGTVGKGIGGLFGKVLGFPETDLEGHWKFRPGYLGSRGVILGTGLEFEVPDRFTMDIAIDGIPDSHEDKGLVRVPTDDRSTLRTWFRTRGRYNESPEEWFDLALSKQSDPGVQSEFFEKDYLEYEQKDNYVHWRKANDQYYFNASAKVLLEDRTDIEELPSVGTYRGLTPIGTIADQPVLYRAYGDVAYLKRRNGDPDYYAPFPDGLGDRDVLRGDTEHRLEMPIPLGFGALIATPFVYGRATAWNEGVDPNETPTRLGLFAGVDLATTLWKRYGRSTVHAISPFVSVHGDIVVDESGGEPVPFDQVEEPIEGQFIDVGLRTRLWKPRTQQHLDLEVRTSHAEDNPDLEPGFQPVAVLGEFFTFAKGVPVAMTHDGRYDVQDGDTDYSRTYIGFEPHPKLGIEFGYNRGLDENEIRLYEAASVGARYRATPKWEFEATETVSIADNEGLHHGFLVRRLGHDFILEIESGYRAGEGASFGISVTPDLSYRRSSLGLIDRWLGVYR